MQTWKEIWSKKEWHPKDAGSDEFALFCGLKRANGFDVAVSDEEKYYQYFYENWEKMYQTLRSVTVPPINSVFEVGCGSGVNLMMFYNRGIVRLGGIDYSESLIHTCRQVVEGDFFCGEAAALDTEKKADIVMADSVFQYFPSVVYAEAVLDKMLQKAQKAVVLCEIHDLEKKEACLSYRRSVVPDYDKRYEGLEKLFLSKQWVKDMARRHGKNVLFTENASEVYLNSRYIYHAYLYGSNETGEIPAEADGDRQG